MKTRWQRRCGFWRNVIFNMIIIKDAEELEYMRAAGRERLRGFGAGGGT